MHATMFSLCNIPLNFVPFHFYPWINQWDNSFVFNFGKKRGGREGGRRGTGEEGRKERRERKKDKKEAFIIEHSYQKLVLKKWTFIIRNNIIVIHTVWIGGINQGLRPSKLSIWQSTVSPLYMLLLIKRGNSNLPDASPRVKGVLKGSTVLFNSCNELKLKNEKGS